MYYNDDFRNSDQYRYTNRDQLPHDDYAPDPNRVPVQPPVQPKKQASAGRGNRAQQAARKQLTICETAIAKLEASLAALDQDMEAAACDAEKLGELYRQQQEVEAELEREMTRWEELSLQAEEQEI